MTHSFKSLLVEAWYWRVSDQSVQKTIDKMGKDGYSILLLFVFLAKLWSAFLALHFDPPSHHIVIYPSLKSYVLTHFQPTFHFYTLWKHPKPLAFYIFRGARSETLVKNALRILCYHFPIHLKLNKAYQPYILHVFSLHLKRESRAIGSSKYYVLVQ